MKRFSTKPGSSSRNKTICRVVVVSPSDVQSEIERLPDIEEELNNAFGEVLGLRVEFVNWRTDAHPGFHPEGPQGLIDTFLEIEDSDVVVGIFWTRFGSPTKEDASGTAHELRRAWTLFREKGRPQVMVYFNQKDHTPQSEEAIEQWKEVLRFQKAFPKEGLWWPYQEAAKFEKLLRNHLARFLVKKYGNEGDEEGEEEALPTFPVLEAPQFSDHIVRGALLAELERLVQERPVVAVEGLSGSGKTYLVSSYLERKNAGPGRSFWYDPQKGDTLDDFLAHFEKSMPLSQQSPLNKCRELVYQLREQDAILVIDDFHQANGPSYSTLIETAARYGRRPARLILISQTFVDRLRTLSEIGHLPVEGFDVRELATFVRSRGVRDLDEKTVRSLIEKADGLPLAASLFTTLTLHFGRNPVDLLRDSMLSTDRLRTWFDEVLSLIGDEERILLRRLAMCDGPFNMSVVQTLAGEAGVAFPERVFEGLQKCYLVQKHTAYRWSIHHLIALFCQMDMSDEEKREIYLTLARHALKGWSVGRPRVFSEEQLLQKTKACRYFQRAGEHEEVQRLLRDIAKTVKATGSYDVFIQLSQEEVRRGGSRNLWIDYDLAHCYLITGRLQESLEVIEPLLYAKGGTADRRLSFTRLYAEVLAAMGNPERALEVVSDALQTIGTKVRANILSHTRSVQADLLLRLDRREEAGALAAELLGESERRGDPRAKAVALTRLGKLAYLDGDWKTAAGKLQNAVELFRKLQDRRGLAWSLFWLALATQEQGDLQGSIHFAQEALKIKESINEASADYLEELEHMRDRFADQSVVDLIDREIRRVSSAMEDLGRFSSSL